MNQYAYDDDRRRGGHYHDAAAGLTWLDGHHPTTLGRGKVSAPRAGAAAAALVGCQEYPLSQPFYDAMVPSSSAAPFPFGGDQYYFGAGPAALAGGLHYNTPSFGDDKGFEFDPSTRSSAEGEGSLSLPLAEDNTAADTPERSGCGGALKRRGDREGRPSSTISTAKKSRTAASHNQSERRRRDKINQKMKILQKMVPNSSKTDKASLLDEAISYMKQLHAQLQVMRAITGIDPHLMTTMMMMPVQQLHLASRMAAHLAVPAAAHMSGFDLNSFPPPPAQPQVLPLQPDFTPFTPPAFPPFEAASWGTATAAAPHDGDPTSAFMAFHAKKPATNWDESNGCMAGDY